MNQFCTVFRTVHLVIKTAVVTRTSSISSRPHFKKSEHYSCTTSDELTLPIPKAIMTSCVTIKTPCIFKRPLVQHDATWELDDQKKTRMLNEITRKQVSPVNPNFPCSLQISSLMNETERDGCAVATTTTGNVQNSSNCPVASYHSQPIKWRHTVSLTISSSTCKLKDLDLLPVDISVQGNRIRHRNRLCNRTQDYFPHLAVFMPPLALVT